MLKLQSEFLAMIWGTELHELLMQKQLLGLALAES